MSDLPMPILVALDKVSAMRAAIIELADLVRLLEPVVADPQHWAVSPWICVHDSYPSHITIYCTVNAMADGVALIRHIRRATLLKRTGSSVYQGALFYYMGKLCVHVQPSAAEGATCKVVEVGQEMKPIYEIQCDGKSLENQVEMQEPTAAGV